MKKRKILTQIVFIVLFLAGWQILYASEIWPEILFPSLGKIGRALITAFTQRGLGSMVLHSLRLLLEGLGLGISAALVLSGLSAVSETFCSIYNMLVSMFDLIPGIALIPVAILWLGVGDGAILFMVFHSVVWPMSRSVIDGFASVPRLYLEAGENMGLRGARLVLGVFVPAALPRIYSGVKVSWARAWRGLISAEMVFGGGSTLGIGYFITDRRTNLDIAGIFAAIIVIVLIGFAVEYGLFRTVERDTLQKWGMTR